MLARSVPVTVLCLVVVLALLSAAAGLGREAARAVDAAHRELEDSHRSGPRSAGELPPVPQTQQHTASQRVQGLPRPDTDCLSPSASLGPQAVLVAPATDRRAASRLALCVVGLAPSSAYEVRLSYPASTPAAFRVSFASRTAGGAAAGAGGTRGGRRLLNTEKLMFSTDEEGQPLLTPRQSLDLDRQGRPVVVVRALPEGVEPGTRDAEHAAAVRPRQVHFNIVLDTLIGGAVPATALRLAACAVAAVALVACGIVPFLLSKRSPLHDATVNARHSHAS